jgi:serine/threonine-protein kinase
VALRAREVQVPALAGRSVGDATQALADVGLAIKVDDVRRVDPKVPSGRVVQQDPPAGVGARRQRTIRVWLSAGPKVITIPPLVGQSERTARIRLQQDGITLGATTEIHSLDYPAGVVVAQDPPSTASTTRVSLLVNAGTDSLAYIVPDLTGLDGRRTAEAMREAGFRVNVVTGSTGTGAAGTVIKQQPAPGLPLGPNDALSLEVSR